MPKSSSLSFILSCGTALTATFLVLLVVLVLPITDQPLVHSKSLLLFVTTLLFLVLFMAKSWLQRFITFTTSSLTLPILLFGSAVLASTFLSSNYPVEHLLGMGGAFLCMALLALFVPGLMDKEKTQTWLLPTMTTVGVVLTGLTLLQIAGFGPSHLLNLAFPLDFPADATFNVTGSSLIAAQVLLTLLVGAVAFFFTTKKASLLNQVAIVILLIGVGIHVWTILPGQPAEPVMLPYTANWSIAVDTLRAPKTALIGFGPQGFQNAYTLFKPTWLNSTDLWNIQFSQGSNTPLTLIVTTGLLGVASWLYLVWVVVRETKQVTKEGKPLHYMLLATFVIQLFFPLTAVMIGLQAILLVLWALFESGRFTELEIYGLTLRKIKNKQLPHPLTNHTRLILMLFLVLLAIGVGAGSYGVGRAFLAEYYELQALIAAQKNDAVGVYNFQRQAVALNPYLDELRRRYSVTNLTIAGALAQKTDATDEEKQQMTQLVQQSIREGQAATLLDPLDTNNWLSLAQVYRSLIGVAEAADQWTANSYISAIQTDPENPITRVELGGVLYGAQNYNQAAQLFQQAIDSKPDYPNGYYNLANALVKLNQLEEAKAVYQRLLQLVPADSEDYITAAKELEAVDAALAEEAKTKPTQQDSNDDETTQLPLSTTPSSIVESPLETVSQPTGEAL